MAQQRIHADAAARGGVGTADERSGGGQRLAAQRGTLDGQGRGVGRAERLIRAVGVRGGLGAAGDLPASGDDNGA